MMERVETRLDGPRLIVRIPMRFQRRGGRKRIVAPDGSELAPSSKPQPSGTLVKALARAWRWQRMLEEGRFGTLADLADSERISRSYVCRVLRLTLLAPDIIEQILDGRRTAGLAHFLKLPGRVGGTTEAIPLNLACEDRLALNFSRRNHLARLGALSFKRPACSAPRSVTIEIAVPERAAAGKWARR